MLAIHISKDSYLEYTKKKADAPMEKWTLHKRRGPNEWSRAYEKVPWNSWSGKGCQMNHDTPQTFQNDRNHINHKNEDWWGAGGPTSAALLLVGQAGRSTLRKRSPVSAGVGCDHWWAILLLRRQQKPRVRMLTAIARTEVQPTRALTNTWWDVAQQWPTRN